MLDIYPKISGGQIEARCRFRPMQPRATLTNKMAWLVNRATGDRMYLAERSLIGRAAYCWVNISHRSISKEHAVMYYTERGWCVKDLGSRNGTWANGSRLDPGATVSVGEESTVQFGDVHAVLSRAEPPTLCLRLDTGAETLVARGGMLSLPDEENPSATVYEKTPGSWVLELDGRVLAVSDGDTFYLGNARYQVRVPSLDSRGQYLSTERTSEQLVLSEVTLRLQVSQDQESAIIELVLPDRVINVPPRATHQVLILLARQRVKDQQAGVDEAECGWIYSDELAEMLALDRERVNVDIHRLRQQFFKLGVLEAARLIERRPTSHQLRLGVTRLEIS